MIYVCIESIQNHKVGVKAIAEEIQSPEAFTGKILQNLSRRGLINSTKGPKGGFYLDESQQQVKLLEIVTSLEGDHILTSCGLGFDFCSDEHPCPLHSHFKTIKEDYIRMLNTTSISDLSQGIGTGASYLHL